MNYTVLTHKWSPIQDGLCKCHHCGMLRITHKKIDTSHTIFEIDKHYLDYTYRIGSIDYTNTRYKMICL